MTEELRKQIIETWTSTPLNAQQIGPRLGISYFEVSKVIRSLPDFRAIQERKKRERLAAKDRDDKRRRDKKMARLASAPNETELALDTLNIGRQRAMEFVRHLNRASRDGGGLMIASLKQIAIKAGFPESVDRTFFEMPPGCTRVACCCDNFVDLFKPDELAIIPPNGMTEHRIGWCLVCGRFYFSTPPPVTVVVPEAVARRD